MILADSSIWADHLRFEDPTLAALLDAGQVLMHPFIIGEVALGYLKQRDMILFGLKKMTQAPCASDDEVLHLINSRGLVASGIGYVDAHLLAADALLAHPEIAGRVYFVSDDAPIGIWTMARKMLAAVGAGTVGPPVPAGLAYAIGGLLEWGHAAFRSAREPLLTRFAVSELSHAQWFDISAAKRDLARALTVARERGLDTHQIR